MSVSRFISSRLARGKNKSFSALIIRLAWIGVGLSVAVMIVSVAVVVGYKHEVGKKVLGFGGDIEIHSTGTSGNFDYVQFTDSDSVRAILSGDPAVGSVVPVMSRPGILKAGDELEGIVFKGVDGSYDTSYLNENLIRGKLPGFGDSLRKREILISAHLSRKLKTDTGDLLRVYFINEPVRVIPCTVTGIYETGLEETDMLYVAGSLMELQRIFAGKKKEITHYEVRIRDHAAMEQVTARLNRNLPQELNAENLKSLNPQIFEWLGYLDQNIRIILGLMIVVACINMITALLILILERTNMIGILKSMGSRNAVIKKIFLNHALFILMLGLLLGNAAGIGICLMQSEFRLITLAQETYYLSYVPVKLIPWQILAINAGTVIICMLALLLPVRLVSRIDPVKAIRFN